jgi:N-acetylneuraminic acid mutarotase
MLMSLFALFTGCRPWSARHTQRARWLALLTCTWVGVSVTSQAAGWQSVASLSTVRYQHTSTVLPSGKVLVAGGYKSEANYPRYGPCLSSAELYDPANNTWAPAASMANARCNHSATLLPSGKILVAGGESAGGVRTLGEFYVDSSLSTTELFDPATNTWTSAPAMSLVRSEHTASLLNSGKVLLAGGIGTAIRSSVELYDPATNTWVSAPSMAYARFRHTATLLPTGKVLVAGGYGAGYLSSAELYDPTTDSWAAAPAMASARYKHTATQLPSGEVLVTGGAESTYAYLTASELYHPATNTWTAARAMATARGYHTATLLPSGKVLVAGGIGTDIGAGTPYLGSVELYDPARNTWSTVAAMSLSRSYHTATLLPSGTLLVAGGFDTYSISAEIYDPVGTNTWSSAGSLVTARYGHTTALLPSGKVLASGCYNGSIVSSAELYDPIGNTWSSAAPMANARYLHSATLLPSGKIFVAGGLGTSFVYLSSAELYDPATNNWSTVPAMANARYSHTATLLPSGKVLVTGGIFTGGVYLNSAELYDPATNTWAAAPGMSRPHAYHAATPLASGKVLVTGGFAGSLYLPTVELYDPATNSWTTAPGMANARRFHTATQLPSGKVLVAAGQGTGNAYLSSAELYDPGTNSWTTVASLTAARRYHTAALLPSGKVLVAAGDSGPSLSSAELYDPLSNSWSSGGSLATARSSHSATLLPSGKVLIAAGASSGTALTSAELYLYDGGISDSRRPVIATVNSPVTSGSSIALSGSGFNGDSEASGGSTNSSATNYPLVQLRRVDNEHVVWIARATASTRSPTNYQSAPLPTMANLPPGAYLLTMYVNGIASNSVAITIAVIYPSSTTLGSSSSPSSFGQSVTVTATVTGSSSPTPSGTVSFCDGGAVSDGSFCQSGTLLCANAPVSTNASVTSAACASSTFAVATHAITARYSGDANYLASSATTFSQMVNPANQTISFGAAPTLVFGGIGTVSATATSGLAVSYSTTSSACAVNVNSGLVNAVAAGSCVIAANQTGNANYNAAPPVTQTITVSAANQTISFGAVPTLVVGGLGTVTATSTSGLAVSFTTSSPECTVNVNSGLVNALAAGSCVIAADQVGNANYHAALQQTQSIIVAPAPLPILDIDDSAPSTQYDAATDGMLLMRYLLGLRDSALTDGAIGAGAHRNATQISQHIAANLSLFDVDGDGLTNATTDGLMILRRLLGITNAAAITQGVKNSARSDADVVTAIDALKP